MTSKTRIAISGIGAVGGYFGGLLAERYFGSADVEIIFVVRKGKAVLMQRSGLKLITPAGEKIIFPDIITDDPTEIGAIDFLICTTKSYDLKENLLQFGNSITSQTIILPLLNGVNAPEVIKQHYPSAEVWQGCVYIVARLIEPAVVKEIGDIHFLCFGSETAEPGKLMQLERLFMEAGIDARLSSNIQQSVWEKFIFISSFASLTTSLDMSIHEVLNDTNHKAELVALLHEIIAIASAKNILFPDNIVETTVLKMSKIAPGAFASLHSDFRKGGKTELASITEYVIIQGRILHIPTPVYMKVYNRILEKMLAPKLL